MVGPLFAATLRRVPIPLVDGVVVIDAPELTLSDYRGLVELGSSGIGLSPTTVLRVRPDSVARTLSDLLPVPGLQVVHT